MSNTIYFPIIIVALCRTSPSTCFHVNHGESAFFRTKLMTSMERQADTAQDSQQDSASAPTSPSWVKCVQGPFDPFQQLDSFWGRRPLLIRQAFDVNSKEGIWPSWYDVLNLACPEDLENLAESSKCSVPSDSGDSARLVLHKPDQLDSFELEIGPIGPDFQDYIKEDTVWTILVNDVDRYLPAVSDWMDQDFAFLPRWRRDDAQVSISPVGGGIGPHVDNYDVFLVQTQGERVWKVGRKTISVQQELRDLIPGLTVRILQITSTNDDPCYNFDEILLKPGDMLYLPPRFVHWGIAKTDGMTLSVGCRAPSAAELVARVADAFTNTILTDSSHKRYTDKSLLHAFQPDMTSPGPSLSVQVKDEMKKLVRQSVNELLNDDVRWDDLVGRLVTEPKRYSDTALQPHGSTMEDDDYRLTWGETPADVLNRILTRRNDQPMAALYRAEGIPVATSEAITPEGDRLDRIYCYGESYEIKNDDTARSVFWNIERGKPLTKDVVDHASVALVSVLEELIHEGVLYASEDTEVYID